MGSKLLKSTRELLGLNSQDTQISDLQEMFDTHAKGHRSPCMFIQLDVGTQCCRLRGEQEARTEAKTTAQEMR